MTINVTIRDLDENAYRKAKILAVEKGKKIGQIISLAIESYFRKKPEKQGKAFLKFMDAPVDLGPTDGKKVDEYLYG